MSSKSGRRSGGGRGGRGGGAAAQVVVGGGREGLSRSSSRDRYGTLEDDEELEPTTALGPDGIGIDGTTSAAGYLLQSESEDSAPGENDGLMRGSTTSSAVTKKSKKTKLSAFITNSNTPTPRQGNPSSRFDYDDNHSDEEDEDDGDDSDEDGSDDDDGPAMSLQELLYSSSSYYAIAKPVTLTMVLAALAVVFVNNDETRGEGEQAMANAYLVWSVDSSSGSSTENLALSLANALVMVSVICGMTFVIVLLYRFRCMWCLVGYMMICSGTLLGVLGGNLLQVAIHIYRVPVDKISFLFFIFNFCIVGVMAVFWAKGIPKYVTQGYLVATAVILAWHLSYFDDWTTWSLLFMLALYDLCAVLTPCGPLKALVNLMSEEEAPEMPGLLFEAELPTEAKRPGVPKTQTGLSQSSSSRSVADRGRGDDDGDGGSDTQGAGMSTGALSASSRRSAAAKLKDATDAGILPGNEVGPTINIPLAIAKVYNLNVISIPEHSKKVMFPHHDQKSTVASSSPLLQEVAGVTSSLNLPENPTPSQLRATVTVRLPAHGGRIEQVSRRGKRVYLERDRHGEPKRILWVDRHGKVFAEMRSDDEDGPERNTIRLGLGDFIFYSVLVAKAAQYSFATFAACMLVILAGLGGTLVLLSVYHHALPALPISIFLGVVFYLMTRAFIEPWIEVVLRQPFYV